MEDADAVAESENPVCGDRLRLWLRVRDGQVAAVSWQAEGCAPAVAAASITSEMLPGMSLDAARRIDGEAVGRALGGLPPRKSHAAALAASTVHAALDNYEATHAMSESHEETR
jgi:nitrogen fixation protein NifU and related proteins